MKSICEQFRGQQEQLYFYGGEADTRVPNFQYLKNHPDEYSKIEFQGSYQDASVRSENLFLETKDGILKFLKRKRAHFSAIEYMDLIEQVKTVQLASLSEVRIQKIAAGACRRPNAIYMKSTHEMLICPSLLNLPAFTLKKVLAHEFGHAIQKVQSKVSCFEQMPRRQVDEAFADWVSSEVIAEILRAEPNKLTAKKKALESQMLFLSIACFSQETAHSYAYPSIQDRIEKIFLAQNAFQDAFQCQNPSAPHCE
jgi:hypothetical protein